MKKTSLLFWFLVISYSFLHSQTIYKGSPIFDWAVRSGYKSDSGKTVIRNDGIRNCPHPGGGHDYGPSWWGFWNKSNGFYHQLYNKNYPLSLMLEDNTAPVNGSEPNTLSIILDSITKHNLRMDFVFADFENTSNYGSDIAQMVQLVRKNSDPNIKKSKIGNYCCYPGSIDSSAHFPTLINRKGPDSLYNKNGLDCAMPNTYPYAYFDQHCVSSLWGTNLCPSVRAALLWAPLERISVAKRNLPKSHSLIPYIAGFICWDGYKTVAPPKMDSRALLTHFRFRGADGYFILDYISGTSSIPSAPYYNSSTYLTDEDYRLDMLNVWNGLDSIFTCKDSIVILNLSTDKKSGLNWSGIKCGNVAKVIVSNLGKTKQRVMYPTGYGLPLYSDYVDTATHVIFTYNIITTASPNLQRAKINFNVYPNPSSHTTVINYSLGDDSNIKISVYDLVGQEVMLATNEKKTAGEHQLTLNIAELQNGIYFIFFNVNGEQQTEKIIINK